MGKSELCIYSIISGILLSLAWFEWFSGIILLVAFLPILFVEDHIDENKQQYRSVKAFNYSFLTFFTWNVLTTWWICNATFVGFIFAVLINCLLMSSVFWIFHITKRKLGAKLGYFGFIVYWLAYEHFCLNAEISWPWLNLGNGFANDIILIQWYEYTGALGGTLWVLMVNVILFYIIKNYIKIRNLKNIKVETSIILLLIISPVIFSLIRFNTYKEKGNPYNIVVLQPNIDPYEKFVGVSNEIQTLILLHLADSLTDRATDYIVAPETAINNNIWEENINGNSCIYPIKVFLNKYPKAKFIVGITSYKRYTNEKDITPTARKIPGTDLYYDSFNTAIQLDSTDSIQLYRKSKLVVGVEKMPLPQYLGFLRKLTLRLGGTFRSHGTQDYRSTFYSPHDSVRIAPVICYESVFGEFVTEYIKNGANFIFIITNDGWWGDTPGYKQHHNYSRLRATETRRSIARSANTGISSLINQKGEIINSTTWWKRTGIKGQININDKLSFYTKHGDFIGRIADLLALLLLLYTIAYCLMNKKIHLK